MKKSTRAEIRMFQDFQRCACGKPLYDKKGAVTAKNFRMKLDHVKLRVYECPRSNGWHLTKRV